MMFVMLCGAEPHGKVSRRLHFNGSALFWIAVLQFSNRILRCVVP